MKVAKALLVILFVIFLAACMSASQSPTPSAKTTVDDSDNTIKVIQKPVSAANNTKEGKNILGFSWYSQAPNIVFLDAGMSGRTKVTGVAFDIDGDIVEFKSLSGGTRFENNWSYITFLMPLDQFRRMASAKIVEMKVEKNFAYSVSSFGKTRPNAIVNGKFAAFLEQVDAPLNKPKQ